MIENKSINDKSYILGQYMTPIHLIKSLLSDLNTTEDTLYVEPSFGTGNFIKVLLDKKISKESIVGCELDEQLYNSFDETLLEKSQMNFYDWKVHSGKKLTFVGNPPFRTPAYSLRSHPELIKKLCKKYGVKGIREESVFFILRCLEIIETNGRGGEIKFILPKTIFTNNSKFFVGFQNLIYEKFTIEKTQDIPDGMFDSASLQMIYVEMKYNDKPIQNEIDTREDYWDYNQIFMRTYLGSVPCESIFLSCKNESKQQFQERLFRLYQSNRNQIDVNLRFNGMAHLKVLNGSNIELKEKKLDIIWDYLCEIKNKLSENFTSYLSDIENYKVINHRNELRYYFRHASLKKMSFVYEINPNPKKSFYFTGNPSKSSTDYFGYCDYDITRNSSPGACRTIPIENLESNLNDNFKNWWNNNDMGNYDKIFELFISVSKSSWYKKMKKKYNRFYFGIPKNLSLLK